MLKVSSNSDAVGKRFLLVLLKILMPSTAGKALRKAAGLCRECGTHSPNRGATCLHCKSLNVSRNRRKADRVFARTGTRRLMPEWQIREIEAQLKWNKENIHTEAIG